MQTARQQEPGTPFPPAGRTERSSLSIGSASTPVEPASAWADACPPGARSRGRELHPRTGAPRSACRPAWLAKQTAPGGWGRSALYQGRLPPGARGWLGGRGRLRRDEAFVTALALEGSPSLGDVVLTVALVARSACSSPTAMGAVGRIVEIPPRPGRISTSPSSPSGRTLRPEGSSSASSARRAGRREAGATPGPVGGRSRADLQSYGPPPRRIRPGGLVPYLSNGGTSWARQTVTGASRMTAPAQLLRPPIAGERTAASGWAAIRPPDPRSTRARSERTFISAAIYPWPGSLPRARKQHQPGRSG